MRPEDALYLVTDYWYEPTDEQIREHLARPLIARLRMLDEVRRFSLIARRSIIATEKNRE